MANRVELPKFMNDPEYRAGQCRTVIVDDIYIKSSFSAVLEDFNTSVTGTELDFQENEIVHDSLSKILNFHKNHLETFGIQPDVAVSYLNAFSYIDGERVDLRYPTSLILYSNSLEQKRVI